MAITLLVAVNAAGQNTANLLANGDFEQGMASEIPGWSPAFYPPLGDDIHRCVSLSRAQAKVGHWSLKIDTDAILGKETTLVFNGGIASEANHLTGRAVVLSGWVYVQPDMALRPIGMVLRAFGTNQEGQSAFLGYALEQTIVGKPGQWIHFQTMGTIPNGKITSMDLHCFIHPDVVRTVQFLDDLRVELYQPPPLQMSLPHQALWRDEAALLVEMRIRPDQPPGGSLTFRLLSANGKTVTQWNRPARTALWGLALPKSRLAEGRYILRADLRNGNVRLHAQAPLSLAASPWEGAPPDRGKTSGRTHTGPVPEDFQVMGTVAPTGMSDEVPTETEPLSPDISPAKWSPQGYAVFSRHYLDPVSRRGRPRPGETSEVRLFTCPGEYEPATLSVWAIRAQPGTRVVVSDLAGPQGMLAANNVDVRVVRTLHGLPPFLEKRAAVDIPAGQTQTFWLTVYVPRNARAGFYQGDIVVIPRSGRPTRRRLLLRVLALRLPPPQKGYGFWWAMDTRWHGYYSQEPEQAKEHIRKQFVLLREHGCNLVSLYGLPKMTLRSDGGMDFDFAQDMGNSMPLTELFRLGRTTGFFSPRQPLQYPGADLLREYGGEMLKLDRNSAIFDTLYRDACREIDRWAKAQGFPLAFACVDEIGNSPERRTEALRFYRLAKEAGVLTSITDNSPESGLYCTAQPRFGEIMKLRLFNFLMSGMIEQTRQSGGILWLYNVGSGGWDVLRDRFVFGLFTERCNAGGCVQWAFQWPGGETSPYDAASAGQPSGYHYALPAPDGPLPTLALEGVREGIQDARYLALVARKSAQTHAAFVQDIAPLSTQIDAYLQQHSGSFLDLWRWRVATAALRTAR